MNVDNPLITAELRRLRFWEGRGLSPWMPSLILAFLGGADVVWFVAIPAGDGIEFCARQCVMYCGVYALLTIWSSQAAWKIAVSPGRFWETLAIAPITQREFSGGIAIGLGIRVMPGLSVMMGLGILAATASPSTSFASLELDKVNLMVFAALFVWLAFATIVFTAVALLDSHQMPVTQSRATLTGVLSLLTDMACIGPLVKSVFVLLRLSETFSPKSGDACA